MDAYAFRSLDCGEYYRIARNLAYEHTFSQSDAPPLQPDTWRTPGYPLFLAGLMLLLGDSPPRLVIAQQALAVLNILLFYRVSQSSLGKRRAMAAGLLFTLEPYGVLYSLWLMSTTWFVTALLLTGYAWNRAKETHRAICFAASGLASGFLVLIWPLAVLVPVALLGQLLVTWLRHLRVGSARQQEVPPQPETATVATTRPSFSNTRMLRGAVVFALGVVLTVGSWMARNKLVAGHFALSHQSGIVLVYFKGTEVALWRAGRTADRYLETSLDPAKADWPHSHWDSIDARLRSRFAHLPPDQIAQLHWRNLAQGNRTTLDGFEVSRALTRVAWSEFTESPLETIVCYAARMVDNLTFPLSLAFLSYHGLDPPSRSKNAAIGGLYTLLLLAVIVRLVRGGVHWAAGYFPLVCSVALLLVASPQVDPRFRVALVPMLIFLALLPKKSVT